MATIKLTNKQLRLIQNALELYSRVGILQTERMLEHPTIEKLIYDKCTPSKVLIVGSHTMRGEIVEIGDDYIKTKGTWGNGEEIKTWTDIDKIELSPDWEKYHKTKDLIKLKLKEINNLLGENGLGIHSPKSDESNREAFDMIQVIRHEFWKENPNKNNITVDSHISLTSKSPSVKVELDTIKEIRTRKIQRIEK